MIGRFAICFANPNHAAAMICALLPLCWRWRRCAWLGWIVLAVFCMMLALTQSRTGLALMAIEVIAMSKCKECKMPGSGLALLGVAVVAWLMWPRLTIDDSILNRPRIWLAGLRLFAANPSGVGLGNSGAVASAFLLPDIPEIRTMISAHITLLTEFGWLVGFAWFAFSATVAGVPFRLLCRRSACRLAAGPQSISCRGMGRLWLRRVPQRAEGQGAGIRCLRHGRRRASAHKPRLHLPLSRGWRAPSLEAC